MPKLNRFFRVVLVIAFFGALGSTARGEKYALLIGINDYPHARQLKGAVNDVEDMRKVMISDLKIPEANIQMLVNGQATKQAIIDALSILPKKTKPGDAVFIYYSGHGWLISADQSEESVYEEDKGWNEALVPFDAVPWPKERAFEANPTLLADKEVSAALGPMRGRRVAVIFDSCHAGNGLRSVPGDDSGRSLYDIALPPSRFKSLTPRKPTMDLSGQVVFIAAAQFRQTASDLGEFDGLAPRRAYGRLTAYH